MKFKLINDLSFFNRVHPVLLYGTAAYWIALIGLSFFML
jgi:hypothetical protein